MAASMWTKIWITMVVSTWTKTAMVMAIWTWLKTSMAMVASAEDVKVTSAGQLWYQVFPEPHVRDAPGDMTVTGAGRTEMEKG